MLATQYALELNMQRKHALNALGIHVHHASQLPELIVFPSYRAVISMHYYCHDYMTPRTISISFVLLESVPPGPIIVISCF
jgi:hypothetical protein